MGTYQARWEANGGNTIYLRDPRYADNPSLWHEVELNYQKRRTTYDVYTSRDITITRNKTVHMESDKPEAVKLMANVYINHYQTVRTLVHKHCCQMHVKPCSHQNIE